MKRVIGILLVLSFLFVAVCGCENKEDNTKKESKPTSSTESVVDTSSEELVSSEEETSSEELTSNGETSSDDEKTPTQTPDTTPETTPVDDSEDPDKAVRERMQGGVNMQGCEGGLSDNLDTYYYKREYYDLIAKAGFNNVRFPIGLRTMIVSEAPEYLLDTEQLRRLDIAINSAIDAGLIIAIDNHGSFAKYYEKEEFCAVWRQLAERYRYYPSELIFELINEPNGRPDEELNENQLAAIEEIRKTNPTRNICIAPNQWNGSWKIWDAACPSYLNERGQFEFDPNVIFAVHMYNPMNFTHQGGMADDKHEAHIDAPIEEYCASVTSALEVCADYEKRTGRTVWINEWGAYLGHKQDNCMQQYYKFTTSELARLDLAYAVWEFNAGFGIFDMNAGAFKDYIIDNMIITW